MAPWYVAFAAKFTEDALNQFFGRVQFLFNFTTQKFVIIRDWRLGLILRLLQIAILIYVLYDVISKASYLQQEVPKGVITLTNDISRQDRKEALQFRSGNVTNPLDDLNYCKKDGEINTTSYNYMYAGVTYKDFSCVVMDELALTIPGESKFFLTTYFRLDKIFFEEVGNSVSSISDCPKPKEPDFPSGTKKFAYLQNVCLYNVIEQYFPVQPELVRMRILHSYFTSVVDKSGSLPETIFRRKGTTGPNLWFASNDTPNFTVQELLEILDIDLNSRLDDQPNGIDPPESAKGSSADDYPFVRLSGVNLIMTFEYYHRALAPGRYNDPVLPKSDDVICLVEIDPQLSWTFASSDVLYEITDRNHPFFIDADRKSTASSKTGTQVTFERNGVQFTFQVSGNLGQFDFFSLIDALVSGAVLLSVAQVIVTYIALYALGLSSALYMEYMRETVNWRKEYARFAAQSLVAGATFMNFDKNNSGTLERAEIYKYLAETFKEPQDDEATIKERERRELEAKEEGEEDEIDTERFSGLSTAKLACLTDFLMRHGEMESDVSRGRLETVQDVKITTINMAEWVDIFTEEKVKISSLNRLVDYEYKDPKVIKVLVALAEGRNLRELQSIVSGEVVHLTPNAPPSSSKTPLLQEGSSTATPSVPTGGEPSRNTDDENDDEPGENV